MTKITFIHPTRGFSLTRFTSDGQRGIKKIASHHIHHVGKDFILNTDEPHDRATGRPFENLRDMLAA